jgi:hypothetical protein
LRKPRRICHSKSNLNLAASRSCREFQTKIDIFLAEIWLSLLSFSMTYSRQKIIPVSECIKSLGFLNLKTRNSAPRPPIDTLLLRTCCMYHSFFFSDSFVQLARKEFHRYNYYNDTSLTSQFRNWSKHIDETRVKGLSSI